MTEFFQEPLVIFQQRLISSRFSGLQTSCPKPDGDETQTLGFCVPAHRQYSLQVVEPSSAEMLVVGTTS